MGVVDKGGTPLVGPLWAVVDERRQAPARRRSIGFDDQRCYAASGLARAACRSGGASVCGVGTVTGHPVHPPARHFTVIPRCARFCLFGDATPRLIIPASWIRYTY